MVTKKNQKHIKYKATIAADNHQLDNITFTDMAGNMKARQLAKNYAPNALCIIACYTLVKRESFEDIKHWIEEIDKVKGCDQIPVILLATKSDMIEHVERAVTQNEG